MDIAEEKLQEHQLRITPVRSKILIYFLERKVALSHADIEQYFNNELDRVTIYRTLNSFVDNGLIHKVSDNSGIAKFALCSHNHIEHNHEDNHVHFKCLNCEQVECLHDIVLPKITLPPKYKLNQVSLLIEGICSKCT